MKQIYLTFLLALTFTISYSQKELQIDYRVKNGATFERYAMEAFLRANQQHVLYKETVSYQARNNKTGDYYTKVENLSHIFKDLKTNTIWNKGKDKILELLVKEEMNLFNWEFTQEIDSILSYKCRKATADFRGRKYFAWFTIDIPFKAAPWKISGLPGVVLKLETTDNFYSLKAQSLAIIDTKKEIKMPFDDRKSINWDDYIYKYKKKIEDNETQQRAFNIKYGRMSRLIYYPKIEVIIDRNKGTLDDYAKNLGLK